VLSNDSDVDADSLTAIVVTRPSNGSLTLNSNGSFIYTPNRKFTGSDRFTYRANDGQAFSNEATVAITVGSATINNPPVAAADTAITTINTAVNIAVLANDSDPDGDPLKVSAVTRPASGSATINKNNTVTFTPKRGFVGTDTFTYTISDGKGGTALARVTVTVQ
jgi:CshA-type fibril repeat protein